MNRNKRLVALLFLSAVAMVGVAYASVPLYSLFCKVSGYGGTTQRVTAAATEVKERWITVGFDSNVDQNLPWDFKPETKSLPVKVGETYTVNYTAHNRGTETLVGMATFNVQPDKVGGYFDKIQCFCFSKQVLKPDQTATLPVQFYIDPAIVNDHDADDVQSITLSYTFFRSKDQNQVKL